MKYEIIETVRYITIKFEERDLLEIEAEIESLVGERGTSYALYDLGKIIRQAIASE